MNFMFKIKSLLPVLIPLLFITEGCSQSQSHEDPEPPEKYYVILMGGQSNMVGQGKTAETNMQLPKNILFYEYGKEPIPFGSKERFGVEVGLWKVLSEQAPDSKFILIKYAIGGSSMYDWAANYDPEMAKITGHPEYGNMFENFMEIIAPIVEGKDTELLALLWMQGERDAKVPEAAGDYHENFTEFIASFRNRLAAENLPVIYGLVNPDPAKYPALPQVQAAQKKIDRTVDFTWLIETHDLEKWEDKVHYSTAGQLSLGRKFGEKVIDILKD